MNKLLDQINTFSSHFLKGLDVVIDLGTSNTRIGIFEKGIVLREPSYIGLNKKTNEYLFFGTEAKEIYGKAPNFIEVTKPIEHSIISDFDSTVLLVRHFTQKGVHPFFGTRGLLRSKLSCYSVAPTSSTEVEQKAIIESLMKADMGSVSIIEKPLATAAGAKLQIFSKNPLFIIDMGGGLIEIAVIIMGGIVAYKTIKLAGEHMDKLIYNYLHLKNGIIIGEQTAEHLKIALFNLTDENNMLTVRGKSLENGLPKSIRVKSSEIREALINNFNQIVDTIKELMETIPPEIIDGIIKNGATITGGLANIKGLESYISNELKIPVTIPDNPQDATINGLLHLLQDKERFNKLFIK